MASVTKCDVCGTVAGGEPPLHWLRITMRVPHEMDWISTVTSNWTVAGFVNLSGDYCSLSCLNDRLATLADSDLTKQQIGRDHFAPWNYKKAIA